jgi:hypothetical protein
VLRCFTGRDFQWWSRNQNSYPFRKVHVWTQYYLILAFRRSRTGIQAVSYLTSINMGSPSNMSTFAPPFCLHKYHDVPPLLSAYTSIPRRHQSIFTLSDCENISNTVATRSYSDCKTKAHKWLIDELKQKQSSSHSHFPVRCPSNHWTPQLKPRQDDPLPTLPPLRNKRSAMVR